VRNEILRGWWNRLRGADARPDGGVWGETVAGKTLARKGYRILGRRVRVGRRDELDLVARHERVLVFVEVKTRKREDFGRPVEAVNRAKQRHLSRAAIRYLARLRRKPEYFRFDVVEVIGAPGDAEPQVRHIENAFPLAPGYRITW
jgi:putative endonuclease